MRVPAVLLLLVVSGMLLPFLGRPLFVDDAAHVAMARDLPSHWLRPYDQPEGAGGWERFGWRPGQPPNEANPPAYHYWTAFWGRLVGWRLPLLHLVFVLPAWLAACSLHAVFRRLTGAPLAATLLVLLSPAFWLTADSLLIDALLLPCGAGGLALALGEAEPGAARLAAGALLVGLAGLVKYTGLLFVPLLALGWLCLDGGAAALRRLPWLLLPLGLFAGWCLWTKAAYGEPHVTAILHASWGSRWNRALVVVCLSFLSGATLLPFAALSRRGWAVAAGLGGLAAAFFASPAGGFPPAQAALLGVLVGGSLSLLVSLRAPRDRAGWFVLAWLAGGLLASFARGSGGWLAGRYFLLALPPLAVLAARAAERRMARTVLLVGLGGLLMACADYAQARANARLAAKLTDVPADAGRWYPAYTLTGLGALLRPAGWKPAEAAAQIRPGDRLVVLTRTLPRQFQPMPENAAVESTIELGGLLPLRVFDGPSGAGFYGSIFGPLPFSFTTGPLEKALVLRAR